MNNMEIRNENYLTLAKSLVNSIEQGDESAANNILIEISELRNSELFNKVGSLTREIHSSLLNIEIDQAINNISIDDVMTISDKINYVIRETERAASSTLDKSENIMTQCTNITSSFDMNINWGGRLDDEEFNTYMNNVKSAGISINENVKYIVELQCFQDITGQILKKLITVIENVETNLIKIINASVPENIDSKKEEKGLHGPQIVGSETETALKNQDDVDDLLSSLGF